MASPVRIGTRGSQLALWQAKWVKARLEKADSQLPVEMVIIKTKGDIIQDVPLAQVGGKGLFVKEIEEALLDGRIDLAVHSMKDMPAELPDGLTIGCIPERELPWDVLIAREATRLDDLPQGAVVGTSSLRRGAQLRHARSDLTIVPLRGNLDTRLKKLADPAQGLDAIVLAAAGVRRLGLTDRITEVLASDIMLPAIGQGALCIETRSSDPRVARIVDRLEHPDTRHTVTGERALLKRLGGSCQIPVAGHARIDGKRLVLDGLVADLDGDPYIREQISGPLADAESLGRQLADRLLGRGGRSILDRLTRQ
jgi:hydroxymethylbilane synthase